jgi:homoserine O-acetyltransferase
VTAAALALAALLLLPVAAAPQAGAEAPPTDSLLLDPDHPAWEAEAPERFRARFRTSEGDFTIAVVRELAPRGADRFYNLVRHGFYDDTRFYRVVPGSWVQFGVSGDPDVTAAWEGRTLPDDSMKASNVRGGVAFAHTGPGTRLTQVFVNLDDNTRLDADGFAPFGRVVEGMEVIESLYAGYGEEAVGGMRAGRQGPMLRGGNAYLDEHFPEMDRIVRAWIEENPS